MKKKCNRKVWPLVANPIALIKDRNSPVSEEFRNKLKLRELTSLENMTKGRGTPDDWQELAAMINFAKIMAIKGIGIEVEAICVELEGQMKKVEKHYKEKGHMVLDWKMLRNLRDMIEYSDLQIQSITAKEYDAIYEEYMRQSRQLKNRILHGKTTEPI